jgi:hypothetical protein
MLGDASEFSPIDLLGTLAVNAAATNFACKGQNLRTGIAIKGEVKAYTDYRFLGGVAAALVGQFGNPMVRRAGHDLATGLLNSYVATETCKRHAEFKIREQGASDASAAAAQIPAAAPAAAPAGAKNRAYARGSMNSSYGW